MVYFDILALEPCSKLPDATFMDCNKFGVFGTVYEQWALSSEKKCNIMRILDSIGKKLDIFLEQKKNCWQIAQPALASAARS